jgi:hypothetical protein
MKRVSAAAGKTGLHLDSEERATFPSGQRSGTVRRISWYSCIARRVFGELRVKRCEGG